MPFIEHFGVCSEEDKDLGFDALGYVLRLAASRRGLAMVCEVVVELRSVPGADSRAASLLQSKCLPASAKGAGTSPSGSCPSRLPCCIFITDDSKNSLFLIAVKRVCV